MAPYEGTQQWHHVHCKPAMAPCNGTQQWHHVHSTIAHYNGTLQWHHVHSTIAHYNGTLQWHPAMAPRPLHPAMAFWCHVQCAKVVRRPPPLLEVRTPIAIAIWGTNKYMYIYVTYICPNKLKRAGIVGIVHIFYITYLLSTLAALDESSVWGPRS